MTSEAPVKAKKPKTTDPTTALANVANELHHMISMVFEEGTTDELARRLELATRASGLLKDIIDAIVESLGARMEDDTMTVAGVGVFTRKQRTSSAWLTDDSKEQMYDDAVRAIIKQVAVDKMTGELHQPLANAVRETWKHITDAFSLGADPKTGFRKTLGLRPDEYRTKYATGYTVTVSQETI